PLGTAARRRLAHTSTAITRATPSLTVIFALSGLGRDSTAEPRPTSATPVTSCVSTPCSIARFMIRPSRAPSCASQPPSSDANPTTCNTTSTLYSTSTIALPTHDTHTLGVGPHSVAGKHRGCPRETTSVTLLAAHDPPRLTRSP